jgi:hypothetical protein
MAFVKNFLIPLLEITIVGGVISYFGFYIYRGFSRLWRKQMKWFFKYKIMRKTYPDETVKWCMDAIDQGIGYYDAKKLLFVNIGHNEDQIYETLYVYDRLILELHHKKNYRTEKEIKSGRKFERGFDATEISKLPDTKNNDFQKTK